MPPSIATILRGVESVAEFDLFSVSLKNEPKMHLDAFLWVKYTAKLH